MKHSELRHQPRHVNPRIQVKKKDFYWRNWAICEEQRAISDKRLCNENIMIIM